jgi:apolipoprotein N-acyltransferase
MIRFRGPMAGWAGQAAWALAWGIAMALAYPRPNLWGLSYICLVPLTLLALHGRPRWRIALIGYLVAAAWVAVMTWWIRPLFPIGYIVMFLYMPLYVVAYLLLLPAAQRHLRLPLTLCVPIVWVGLEWVRGAWVLGGFPYFLLGQSQPVLMIQTADLFGAYGVSFIVAMGSGAICDLIELDGRSAGMRRGCRRAPVGVALWLGAMAGSLVYGAWRIAQAPQDGPQISIAVIQSNVPQSHKMRATDQQKLANFRAMLDLSRRAAAGPVDLIAWPETTLAMALDDRSARTFPASAAYRQELEQFVAEHRVPMLIGALAVPWGVAKLPPGSWYNSAYLFGPGGLAGRYDKVHRLPLGEYVPLAEEYPSVRKWAERLMPAGRREYWITRGAQFTVLEVADRSGHTWRLAAPICFEDVMTAVGRKMVWSAGRKRVDLLVNISNDGWFAASAQGAQHEQMARFRCVENRVPMARAVNTGVSGFIDSTGRVVGRVEADGRTQNLWGQASARLTADGRHTLFGRIGDAIPIACAALTLCIGAVAMMRGWLAGLARPAHSMQAVEELDVNNDASQ